MKEKRKVGIALISLGAGGFAFGIISAIYVALDHNPGSVLPFFIVLGLIACLAVGAILMEMDDES